MTCNIWIISFKFNWILYELGKIMQLRGCVLCMVLRSSVLVVFNHFLILDATDRSKIKSNQFKLAFTPFFIFANILCRPSVCLVLHADISAQLAKIYYLLPVGSFSFVYMHPLMQSDGRVDFSIVEYQVNVSPSGTFYIV